MDDLLSDFLTETRESLAELDVAVLRLERAPDDKNTLSSIFRGVHTIKGTCGFLGLPRLEKVAHATETLLGRVRDGALGVTPAMISHVLGALDAIRHIVNALTESGAEPSGNDDAQIEALNGFAEGRAVQAVPAAPPAVVAAVVEAPEPEANAGIVQTIRVGVDVLENLMTLVSELVLTRNQLLQLSRTQVDSAFSAPLQRLSHITSDLQEGVMKTRMQPVGNAWSNLPRLVRDLSQDLGKKIELVMIGADTELDRQVLELIKDPLTHMVRNSGDHGLESPAQRHAAGKPETGRISLNAYHEGGYIVMEISDDGRGLSVEKIRAKAIAQELASEAELAAMTEAQVQSFIFRPGFSTAAAVTSVSGRGVGMDVVKTNIEKIGGTIALRSVEGAGTTFTVRIPLTLAIVSGLIVEAGGERFAIPQLSVIELVRVSAAGGHDGAAIERINDTPVLRLRDRLLPLVSLTELLRLDPDGEPAPPRNEAYIVVTAIGASTMGIIVDRVFDTEEIVVKPVAPILRHITLFSGNTILGDGSVIMILDTNGIARAVGAAVGGDGRVPVPTTGEAGDAAETVAMLVFRAGGGEAKAVPLGLVARIENIPRERIEQSAGRPMTQYRGKLMPLIPLGDRASEAAHQPVLVFADRDRSMGLMVDEIVDVVQVALRIELGGTAPGLLGTAVIAGQATGILDTGHWLTQAWHDWFDKDAEQNGRAQPRLLVVEDSVFFRQMIAPALSAAGYEVITVGGAAEALALRDAGTMVDLVISDIEMPEMNGFELARRIRGGGGGDAIWAGLPMIALSGRVTPDAVAQSKAVGFGEFIAKFERDTLVAAVQRALAQPVGAC